MKTCSTCKTKKEYSEFSVNKTKSDGYQTKCKPCKKAYNLEYYSQTKARFKEQRALSRVENVRRNQQWLYEYLSAHPCVDCSEPDVLVLEFDHLPQFEKRGNVASLVSCSIKALKSEIQRCEVVCANCHRRRTYSRMESCWRVDLGGLA